MTSSQPLPLDGVRVLDFSRILSGPHATMMLGDMGAEVIKVEPIGGGDETRNFPPFVGEHSHYFVAFNRNKKSIALDLKSPEGARVAKELALSSTVVVENFRDGVMDRLGLGYETLRQQKPDLIYCSITGFGADSPLRDEPAFDLVVQALSGVMTINTDPGEPPRRLGLPMGDLAGSIYAVFGIQAALYRLRTTGQGGRVEVAMLDGLMALLGYLSQIYFVSGQSPKPFGNRHPSITPYGSFQTADSHVVIACLTEGFWINLTEALDRPDLRDDPRFAKYQARFENRDVMEREVAATILKHPTAYWLERLKACDVPHAPILNVGEAITQPHMAQRGMIQTAHHAKSGDLEMISPPIRFDGSTPAESLAPPLLGENSAEILRSVLNLSEDEIQQLIASGAVAISV